MGVMLGVALSCMFIYLCIRGAQGAQFSKSVQIGHFFETASIAKHMAYLTTCLQGMGLIGAGLYLLCYEPVQRG